MNNFILLLVYFLIGLFFYAPSLNHPFMIDDHTLFDATMNDIRNLPHQFLPDKAKSLGISDGPGDVYYRPLALAIPMLSRVAFGPWTWGYHFVNLLLFVAAAWLIYYFFRRRVGESIAALAGLFFVMHPINGLLVNYITASVFSAQVILMLLALHFLCRPRNLLSGTQDTEQSLGPRQKLSGMTWSVRTALSVFFYILAMMCHESAMALPFYAFAFLKLLEGMDWKKALKTILPMLIILVIYLWWRMDNVSLKINILDKYAQFNMGLLECLATVVKLALWYVRQLYVSDGIVVIWLTPVVREWVGLWLLAGAAVLGGSWFLFQRNSKYPALRLGLIWFFLGFMILPFASLYHMPQMMIEPHWFIFSVLGFFLCLAWAVSRLLSFKILSMIALPLLLISWFLTVQTYNQRWSTELGYCQWWLSQVPQFKPIHATVARAYFAMGKLKEARAHYNQVLFNSHSDFLIYTNIGTIDLLEGKVEDAKKHLKKAISIEDNAQTALNTLGVMAIQEKDYDLARSYFKRAQKANPYAEAPKQNLARLKRLEQQGRTNDPEAAKIDFRIPY